MAFFEFNIAMSGLFAAQRGLQVTSNNISNANTTGYSRQVLGQKASTPLSGLGVGMTGTGVSTTGISRMRDSYIDSKLWGQNPKLGEYNIKVTQNSLIEAVYGEPSDAGFTTVFNSLFNTISNLSKDPSSGDAQMTLRQELINYTKYYNNITGSLQKYQQDLNYQLKATVQEVNTLATRIQSLNKQIFESELYGDDANNFRDERDLCIDRLSQIGNVEIVEYEEMVNGEETKRFRVNFAGQILVDHFTANTLSVEVRGQEEKDINAVVKELQVQYKALKELDPADADLANKQNTIELEIDKLEEKAKSISSDINIDSDGSITYKKDGVNTQVLKVNADRTTSSIALAVDKLNPEDAADLYDIVWNNGMPFNMSSSTLSGELKGIIDMRDGCGSNAEVTYNGIPYYIRRMDNYVRQFAQVMNEQYSMVENGYIAIGDGLTAQGKDVAYIEKDEDGKIIACYDGDKNKLNATATELSAIESNYTTRFKLFTYKTNDSKGEPTSGEDLVGNDYRALTAANFSISKEVFDSIKNLRTTYDEMKPSDDEKNPSDTRFLLELLGQKDNKEMFKEGDPKDYMIAIFSELGINAKEAQMYQSTQESVTSTITNQRLAVSQVDQTEEFTLLIKYQQAYQAAAKIMNTIDGIYETTIFKLGNF